MLAGRGRSSSASGGEAEGGDADAEGGAQAAQAVGQRLVLDRRGIDQFAALRPHARRRGSGRNPRGRCAATAGCAGARHAGGTAAMPSRCLSASIVSSSDISSSGEPPVSQSTSTSSGIFPEVADRRVLGEGLAEGEGEAAVDFEVAGDHRAELADPQHGVVHQVLIDGGQVVEPALGEREQFLGAGERGQRRAAAVVALALLDLGDRRGRIAGHDREMVAQRGVRVIARELQAGQADQLGALDGIARDWPGAMAGRMSDSCLRRLMGDGNGGCVVAIQFTRPGFIKPQKKPF